MIHSLNHLAHTLKIAKDELLSLVNNDNISKYYQEYEILKFHSDGQPKIDKNGRQKRRIIKYIKAQRNSKEDKQIHFE